MTRFEPIAEQKSMHLQVADAIRNAILRGELKVGERLPLAELGKEIGVSRMPVREALIRLEKEGLVEFHMRRGAQVAGITEEQINDITNLRSMLEIDALKRAADNFKDDDLAEARKILNHARACKDPDELSDLHWRFHHCLYAPSNRPIQMELIDTLHSNVDRFFRIEWREAGLRRDWVSEHEEIVSHLENGELNRALKIVEDHMWSASRRLASFVS